MVRSLRDLLEPALREAGMEATTDLWRLGQVWPRALGRDLCDRATPLCLTRGELTVSVPEAVWRQELAMLAPRIRTNLNRALGHEAVHRIRFVGRAPQPEEPRTVARRLPSAARGIARPVTSAPPSDSAPLPDGPIADALHALARARTDRLARERDEPDA